MIFASHEKNKVLPCKEQHFRKVPGLKQSLKHQRHNRMRQAFNGGRFSSHP
jgi:hypothetical protein